MYSFRRSFLLVVLITASFSVPLLSPVDSQAQKANVDFDPNIVYIKPGDTSEKSAKVRLTESPAVSVTVKLEVAYQNSGNSNSYVELSGFPQSLTFTKDNYSAFQEFRFKATGQFQVNNLNLITAEGKEGDKRFSGGLSISIGEGPGSRTVGKVITDPEVGPTYIYSDREKKNIKIKLSIDPAGSVKIRITQPADNNGAITLSKREFTFTSANYGTFQSFEIAVNQQNKTRESELIIFEGSNSKTYFKSGLGVAVSGVIDANFSGGTGAAGFGSPLGALISEETGFVYQAWRVTRSVINILLIIALFAISFSNITRINIDTYTIKKALPNLVIGIILANASLYIIRFMSDITTVVTYFFVNQVDSTTFADFIGDTAELIGRNTLETIGWGVGLLAPLLIFLFALVTIIGLLWLAFLLYFRLVAIYLLTILSPLAFVSYGIPGFDKYFKQWWQQFTKWLFILPAMSAVFWLMLVIGEAGESESIARLLIMYVLFFTALTLPSKMGGAVIDKASKAFMKYTGAGAVKQGAIETAGRTGQQLALRAPLYGRLKKSMEFAKKAQEQDIKNLQASAESKAMRGRNYRKFARTTKRGEELSNYLAAEQAKANTKAGEGKLANFLDRLQRRGGSLPERQISSAYNKGLEEAREKIEMNRKRVAFTKNDDNKKLMEQFAAASSKDKAFADAVQSAEREVTGIYTTGRKDVISKLREAGDVANEIETIKKTAESDRTDEQKSDLQFYESYHSELLADIEKLKKDHDDLAGMSAKDLVDKYQTDKTFSTLVKAEEKRQAKAFNEGIKAQNEDTLADGSVKSILKDINEGLKELNETDRAMYKKKFFNNDTIGIDSKFQNTLIKNIQALKDIGKNQRDTRSPEALRELASMIMKDGEKPIVVKSRTTGEEHIFDNFDEFQSKLFSGDKDKKLSTQDMKNAVLSHDSISGTPASHLGKTPKKDD